MQPCDFTAPGPVWVRNCYLCGRPYNPAGWSIPRVCCIKINVDPERNGVMVTPHTIKSIVIEHSHDGQREKLILVDFHEDAPTYNTIAHMHNKTASADEACAVARVYWRKWSHREYQRAIAQWLQRELYLPGEVANAISEFA